MYHHCTILWLVARLFFFFFDKTLARLVETMLKGRMTVVYWKQQRSFFLECDARQNG